MKKFHNVIIASDMDGTFLTQNAEGIARNRGAIEYFKANGGHFTFASGRTYRAIQRACPDLAQLTNAPVLACNGACLYDYQNMRELERRPVEFEYIKEFIEFLEDTGLPAGVRMITGGTHLFYKLDYYRTKKEYENISTLDECLLIPLSEWSKYPLYRMTVRADDDVIDKIVSLSKPVFGDRLGFAHSEHTMLDVQSVRVNKAVVLKDMASKYFDRPMFLCAVGDYANDIEMLSCADLACCPENAIDAVKAISHHTLCHHDKGVIADVIDVLDKMF